MGTLFAIGEVLIDFIPLQKGAALKDVVSFERAAGGAPANVAAAVAKYGAASSIITKLGNDAFGDFLLEQLAEAGVRTDLVQRTSEANTGLAFVSLRDNGERDFSFYRNPSADLLLSEDEIDPEIFHAGDILHFGSVDLVESPMKRAHLKAIEAMKSKGGLVSFDPNVRLPLWSDPEECRRTIQSFIPKADLLKISEDELAFITGIEDEEEALASLFTGEVQAVIFTKGPDGAELILPNTKYTAEGYKVQALDTTGAGDAFVGGFLYQLLERKATKDSLTEVLAEAHESLLKFANASGALTTTGKGAIPALPTIKQIMECIKKGSESNG
ncbi:carbohydrate kinase [Paenibacillus sp. CAA11]|uniref:carbohydrate kinase family protein n=1 Tax=Paenibacillus sp. CAA11 TaxID=1532905 RepID=UPI000D367A11|nr:carbohydrate kinase [Paenibacillus sp. CAA11]AWB45923.1 carbohydrate kinase [Paenibacillus sp. CAA11]